MYRLRLVQPIVHGNVLFTVMGQETCEVWSVGVLVGSAVWPLYALIGSAFVLWGESAHLRERPWY